VVKRIILSIFSCEDVIGIPDFVTGAMEHWVNPLVYIFYPSNSKLKKD